MTDVSNLDNLAAAIASSSPAIRNYALAQAAATQSQELDIQGALFTPGPQGPQGGNGPQGLPGPPGPPGSGGALPAGYYNVLEHGLVDDEATNNTPALQTLINTIPAAIEYGAYATFIWPKANKGIYGFGSVVNWGERAIRNVGLGSPASIDIQRVVAVQALNQNMTIFRSARSGAGGHAGPSFENLGFYGNGKANVIGLDLFQMNGVTLRDVMFRQLATGLRLDEGAVDCAYHYFENLNFHGCGTGFKSVSSNSWTLVGFLIEECPKGFELRCNQAQIYGGKYNTPIAGNAVGIYLDGYTNLVSGTSLEMLTGGGDGNVLLKISDAGLANGQNGCFNEVVGVSLSGGGSTSYGLQITTGASQNQVDVRYKQGFGDDEHTIQNLGDNNRINYGAFTSTAAKRLAAQQRNRGCLHLATDTNVLSISTGTAWRTIATT